MSRRDFPEIPPLEVQEAITQAQLARAADHAADLAEREVTDECPLPPS